MSDASLIGRTFGDFALTERLGVGGAGEVFRAEQLTLGREAVIKVMTHRAVGDDKSEAARRFLREARLASQLDHPFAAHIYGFGAENDGTLWIAMELVRGDSLDAVIKEQGAVPVARFAPFFDRLCEVLHAMHEQGIIHRDIKPHNVMVLSRAGRLLPKLLDLGIARRSGEAPEKRAPANDNPHTPAQTMLAEDETFQLTSRGSLVGTPHYLPPEQWRDASHADARSDIYSLAILAYQALTGRLPYADRNSLPALAAAHAKLPLPPLPEDLPPALYDVLSKGAAKNPEDRFTTVLEFAAAMRAALGIGVEPLALPQLDKALLDTLLGDAPQPIAEAVSLLEGARTPKQQWEAVHMIQRVVARYLAVLALACRGRVGPGAAQDSEIVVALLEQLAVKALSDEQWLSLARELCRPFAFRRAAHPMPELVSFFFADGVTAGAGEDAWQALAAIAAPDDNDQRIHAALLELVPALGLVLQRLSFLFDYALVVQRKTSERWMGTRRVQRLTQEVRESPGRGLPFLVDRVGLPVVTLAPLMQVIAPSGGMPEELFVLDGAGRSGARMIALPGPYERHSEAVWAWLSANVVDVTRSQAAAVDAEKAPYKGLSTFSAEDADNYFGREHEAESFANRLRGSPLLAVVGPSGTGKSSFVLAGVLPLLPAGWRAVVARPGAAPFAALLTRLAAAGHAVSALEQLPEALDGSLLIVVDQFEELITLCQDPQQREAFAAALVALADHPSERVRVVLTLRDDFLIKAQALPALRDRLSSSLQLLATPAEADLLRVVTEPARRVGYAFDDAGLPRDMVRAVAEYPGALALLSFTASQMWELRDRALRQLRAKTYAALGGVGGALAHHAEGTLAQMSSAEQKLVREAFRHLVTAQGTRAVLSRQEMLEVLGASADAQSVLEKLTVARLLVTSESAAGDSIEIIHEALIVAWPRLVAWQREDAETARLRDSLRASARQWEDRGRPRGLLWRAETLTEYKVWRARYPGRLTALEDHFAGASLRDETRGRRIRQGLSVSAFVVLVVGLIVIFRAYRESQQRFLAMREEQGRLALLDDHPLEALAYLHDATKGGADNPSLRRMAGVLASELQGDEGVVTTLDAGVLRLLMSPDKQWLVALGSGTQASVTHAGATAMVELATHCESGAFAADSSAVFLGCTDGKLRALEVASHSVRRTWDAGASAIFDVAAPPDGVHVIITQGLTGVRSLELTSGAFHDVLADATSPTLATAISPDGKTLAIFGGFTDEQAQSLKGLVLVEKGAPRRVAMPAMVMAVAFAPGGKALATSSADGTVGLYDLVAQRWAWRKPAHAKSARSVAFAPDGEHFVTGGEDALKLWARDGTMLWTITERGSLSNMCWAPDSKHLFAGGSDVSLFALDALTGTALWRHFGHTGTIWQCAVSGDGKRVYSSSVDATVRQWDATLQRAPAIAGISDARDIEMTDDGKIAALVSAHGAGTIDARNLYHPVLREEEVATAALSVAIANDGTLAVLVDRRLRLLTPDGAVALDTELSSASVGARFTASGAAVIVLTNGADGLLSVSRDGKTRKLEPVQGALYAGVTLDDTFYAACSAEGKLRLFALASGKVVSEAQAHKGICFVDVAGAFLRTTSDDKSIAWWSASDGQLHEERRVSTTFDIDTLGAAPALDAINLWGGWNALADDGLPLGQLTLRRNAVVRAAANAERFLFIDREGAVASFAPPRSASASALERLFVCRSPYDAASGRLVARPLNDCGGAK